MPLTIVDDYPLGTARGNTCYVCGAGVRHLQAENRRERIVDLNRHIDFEGHLLVCETCWVEGARMLGMSDDGQAAQFQTSAMQLEAELAETLGRLAEAEQLVRLLRGHGARHTEGTQAQGDPGGTTTGGGVTPAPSPAEGTTTDDPADEPDDDNDPGRDPLKAERPTKTASKAAKAAKRS